MHFAVSKRHEAAEAAGPQRKGGRTVLVVDDYPSVCQMVACQVEVLGYHALTAFGGKEAQDYLVAKGCEKIDLLITDMEMPRMRGDELAEWFQKKNPRAKVLLMAIRADGMKIGGSVGFLRKPFRIEALDRQMRRLLDGEPRISRL